MKNWFLQKNDTDQKIIVSLAVFSVLMILYTFLYLPLKRNNEQLKISIDDIQSEITQMQNLEIQVAGFSNRNTDTAPMDSTQLMVLIEQVAEQQKIKLSDIKKQDGKKISVSLNKVAFNAAMRWLDVLKSQYHIKVDSFSVDAEKKGLANITMIITH